MATTRNRQPATLIADENGMMRLKREKLTFCGSRLNLRRKASLRMYI